MVIESGFGPCTCDFQLFRMVRRLGQHVICDECETIIARDKYPPEKERNHGEKD